MTFSFVQARYDYGIRKGPPLAFVIHLAEGGGTVGYLANDPARGVSVHYVIDVRGKTTQMLREDHASGSINPKELRTSDDADGFYGATAAKKALGDWWRDPNSAVISLEIEGFAATGPSKVQQDALASLVADVRSRHPQIVLLGHRDFTTTKACPGRLIPWDRLGGHGTPVEGDMQTTVTVQSYPPRTFTTKAGLKTLRRFNATAELAPITALPYSAKVDADVTIEQSDNRVPHGPGFLRMAGGGSAGFYILAAEVDLAPVSDPVTAALDHVRGPAQAVLTAIDEATPRP